jgi:NAD-dependent dihydropyrimidine dehydrogenase PreA subunit
MVKKMSVLIDYNKCDGVECAECMNACPMEVFTIEDNKIVVSNEDECTFCMICEDVCPKSAVKVKD